MVGMDKAYARALILYRGKEGKGEGKRKAEPEHIPDDKRPGQKLQRKKAVDGFFDPEEFEPEHLKTKLEEEENNGPFHHEVVEDLSQAIEAIKTKSEEYKHLLPLLRSWHAAYNTQSASAPEPPMATPVKAVGAASSSNSPSETLLQTFGSVGSATPKDVYEATKEANEIRGEIWKLKNNEHTPYNFANERSITMNLLVLYLDKAFADPQRNTPGHKKEPPPPPSPILRRGL